MEKRGQTGLEFLFAYGWVLVVFLISTTSLGYLVYSGNTCPVDFQFTNNLFVVKDHKFIAEDAIFPEIRNLFYIMVQNNLPERVKITKITIKKDDEVCGAITSLGDLNLDQNEISPIYQGNLTNINCWGASRSCYKFETEIEYTKSTGGGLPRVAEGMLAGGFEEMSDRWSLGGWSRTNYTYNGNDSIVNNRSGGQLNICINESYWTISSNDVVAANFGDPITWDLPEGCVTTGLSGVGFSNATLCTINAPTLSKGWIHTTLYVDPIFSEHSVLLEGSAGYYDNFTKEWKNNGICMNDNLYFYVNDKLIYWGGTTGKLFGGDNYWEVGDEVLRNCTRCGEVDSSAWCIPAFNLTTADAGFEFGVANNVTILIEDFCKGGSETHAGGMSRLSVSMV